MQTLDNELRAFLCRPEVHVPPPAKAWEEEHADRESPFEGLEMFTDPDGDRYMCIYVPMPMDPPEIDQPAHSPLIEELARRYCGFNDNEIEKVQHSFYTGFYGNRPYLRLYTEVITGGGIETNVMVHFTGPPI